MTSMEQVLTGAGVLEPKQAFMKVLDRLKPSVAQSKKRVTVGIIP